MQFEFASPVECNYMFMQMGNVATQIPELIDIVHSDNGVDWTRIGSETYINLTGGSAVGVGEWARKFFDGQGAHRYWRVWVQNSDSTNFRIAELQIGSASFPTTKYAQSFTPTADWNVKGWGVYGANSEYISGGVPTNDLTFRIETDGGNKPSGTLVGTEQNLDDSGGEDWKDVTFSSTVELSEGVQYWLVLDAGAPDGDKNEMYTLGADSSEGYAGGLAKFYNGTSWKNMNYNLSFRIVRAISNEDGYWNGNLIWVADNVATGSRLPIKGVLGATNITSGGTYDGISVEADKAYTFQFWAKYTSSTEEIYENGIYRGIDLIVRVRTDDGVLDETLTLIDRFTSTGVKWQPNEWNLVAVEFTPTTDALVAFDIEFESVLTEVDGKLGITGWMCHSSDWEHNWYPEFLTTPSPTVYSACN